MVSPDIAVSQAFVTLTSSLVNGYDVVDLLDEVTTDCARLLDVASAGLLLADGRGVLHVMAGSSEATRQLELFQLQRDEGPCRDCYRTGSPISVPDLEQAADRWPHFVPAARAAGFASVHAVPMRLRHTPLGVLGLFGDHVGDLDSADLSLGQALADVATVALVQDHAITGHAAVTTRLQQALTGRVALEQAKGFIAQRGHLDMADAFTVLRRYARDHTAGLTDVAHAVVSRSLPAQQVLDHRPGTLLHPSDVVSNDATR